MVDTVGLRVAETFKQRLLSQGVPLIDLRLYGSRARGDQNPDSDVDLCLTLSRLHPEFERIISDEAWAVGFEAGVVVTTVEYTPKQLQDSPIRSSPFIAAIHRDGVKI